MGRVEDKFEKLRMNKQAQFWKGLENSIVLNGFKSVGEGIALEDLQQIGISGGFVVLCAI